MKRYEVHDLHDVEEIETGDFCKYEDVVKYIENLVPYCDNCINDAGDDACDECHRKAFNWQHAKLEK